MSISSFVMDDGLSFSFGVFNGDDSLSFFMVGLDDFKLNARTLLKETSGFVLISTSYTTRSMLILSKGRECTD